MINMFLAVTILLVLGGAALLAMFSMPWWLTVLVVSICIFLLGKLFNPAAGNEDGKAGN
jgi:membrane protein implicated in regulation of membrane protease activity